MSFQELNKDVLEQVAKEFGVEWTVENPKKNQMLKDLKEEGVTWAMYKAAFPDPEDEDENEEEEQEEEQKPENKSGAAKEFTEKPKQVLVRMERENGTFQVRGYTFTRSHPFLPVGSDDADYLVNELGGFKIATPREVEEYYS